MTKLAFSIVLVIACLPLAAQNQSHPIGGKTRPFSASTTPSYKDPNLRQSRVHPDRTTVSPEGGGSSVKANQQLDKMERQTNQILSQSAPKQKTFVPKYQTQPEKKTTGFEQTMPVRGQGNGLKSAASSNHRSNQPPRAASRYH
ncbi:MAG TPA: hypothetical protein VJQ82_28195 [Terriglobales bacterium]|nr:hypothetical protein [Terriglobales bacterium]